MVSGATIVVTATGTKATSNAKGVFQIKPIPAGKVQINVTAPKYKDAAAENIKVKKGQSTSVTITLEPA